MTHTLLRTGAIASQKKEFCWLAYQTKGVNDADLIAKALDYIAMVEAVGGDNWGDKKTGSIATVEPQAIKDNFDDSTHIGGVFSSKEKAVAFVRDVIAKNPGLSVTIAGILPEIAQICRETDIAPHSANFSLGVWGRKEKLPDEKTLSITTMCGHHMIPTKYVEAIEEKVAAGMISPDEGAQKLAAFCYCGMFNPVRCAEILAK